MTKDNHLHWGEETEQDAHSLNNGSNKPVLFLDIDGVINSYPAPKPHMIKRYGEYKHAIILGYPIWWSPGVVDFFNALHASGEVDIVWLTTWVHEARTEFAPRVGLEDFPAITSREGGDYCWTSDWWKWRRVRDFLGDNESQRPVVWIDDDLSKQIKQEFWYRYDQEKERSLLLTPMGNPGLTPAHLEEILAFLKGKTQGN